MLSHNRRLLYLIFTLFALIATVSGAYAFLSGRFEYGLTYSPSPSMPYDFYITKKVNNLIMLRQMQIAVFPMPKALLKFEKYYYKNGLWYPLSSNLIKFAGCVQGQVINTINRIDYCNGKKIAMVPHYATNFPLKHDKIKSFYVFKHIKIPNGYFFAMGPDKYSLDSRYFGLVKVKNIKEIASGYNF
jgi:type IV secretory pathway protease TraF